MYCLKSKKVNIKKPRKCFCCCRIFPVGTYMTYESWADGGSVNNTHTCKTCKEIISKVKYDNEIFEGFVCNLLDAGQTPEQYLATFSKEEK